MFGSINKVIKILIFNDLVFNSAWGFLAPVFAIFIVQNISSGNAATGAMVAGFSSLFYWVIKAILQIPMGRYLDNHEGEKDDFAFMVFGMIITALIPIGYFFSSTALHIYLLESLHGVGMAMFIPAWYAVFTRHIDKGREAFEWGFDSTSLGLGVGITGAIGGAIASVFGFKMIFILAAAFNFICIFLLLAAKKEIYGKPKPGIS